MPTPEPLPQDPASRHVVTAVLVAHEGQHWLPRVTAALAEQTVQPQRLIAVDTSSADASAGLLAQLVGGDGVIHAARGTGFGAAVALALQSDAQRVMAAGRHVAVGRHAPPGDAGRAAGEEPDSAADANVVEWLWLLHDDCEPAPDALAKLLEFVAHQPSVGVVGPKIRGWHDRRLLLEVGVSIARSGRRETGLERREQDQGQHDGVHDVLAVSTAGMLVRRDVWDRLGGLDRSLPLFRDDVDFGWRANLAGYRVVCCTDAVVYHAEAAARGRRPHVGTVERRSLADRRSAMSVLLYNLPLSSLPWAFVRIIAGSLLRIVSLLFGKAPRSSLDELLALLSVLLRPDRIVRARFIRRRTRVRPPRSVLPLLATPASNLRHAMESVTSLIGIGPAAMVGAGAHRAVESGPGGDSAENLPFWATVLVRQVIARPPVLLGLTLIVVTLLSVRDLLIDGRLLGGALLPAPDSARDLWRTYVEGWHPVGVGSDSPAAPYVAVVAALASVLFGSASLAVDLLLLGAVPAAGFCMYVALRSAIDSVPLRLWAACAYAFSPPLVAAVAAGRLGTAVLAPLLPVLGVLAARAIGASGAGGSTRAAWGAALVLAVIAAFTPAVYAVALVVAVVALIFWVRRRGTRLVMIIVAVPPLLLAPWLPALVAQPRLLLREAGLPGPGLADPDLPGWALILLNPGGPGTYPVYFAVGLVLPALVALLRRDRRELLAASWLVAGVGLSAALALSRVEVPASTLNNELPAWPGPGLVVAAAAMVVAAVVGAEGARERVARSSFGWRQPSAALLAALAVATPIASAGWWVYDGAGGPLDRRDPVLLPAIVAAEGERPERPRTLVLRPAAAGRLSYSLLRADGPRLGDAEIAPASRGSRILGDVVADLSSGGGGASAADLLPYAVRFVLVSGTDPASIKQLLRALNGVPGLVRISGSRTSALWKVDLPTGRVRIIAAPEEASTQIDVGSVVPAGAVGAIAYVGAGTGRRWVVLADARNAGWEATLNDEVLPARTYDGWAQAFVLPQDEGQLEIRHEQSSRQMLMWVQLGALLLTVVVVLPNARTADDVDDVFEPLEFSAAQPPKPSLPVRS